MRHRLAAWNRFIRSFLPARPIVWRRAVILAVVLSSVTMTRVVANDALNLVFCCAADNDLYRVMTPAAKDYARVVSAAEAIRVATPGSGVLILIAPSGV